MSVDHPSTEPYERLEASDVATRRRRIRLISLVSTCACVFLVLVAVVLLATVIPRVWYYHRLWPYPNNPCSRPFSSCPVVLISMDGFRHDYLELVRARYGPDSLPNFARFQQGGVRAMRLINVYPTITMPNHHTLVTGLHPESHGVVANNIRDTKFPGAVLRMNDQNSLNEAPWINDWPEPIWVTLQRTGRLAGSLLWPLTDGPVHGDLPFMQVSQFTLIDQPEARYSYTKRITDLLWWLRNPRFHLDLILAYFDEPDETGHAFGPESEEVAKRVVELDHVLGLLMDGLAQQGLQDQVDIILTADHGMAAINQSKIIPLYQFVDPSLYSYTQLSTMGFLYPNPG
ncbi:Phosphodiesterase-nucleotide pyrophosphatase [Fasciolopsis buskii]|uniref:Phosphodiesterase-nucleotide pyrophosphatase n=1 Tax=Fasciolopsis buskii TaxID=27845 RepID=A0A8E0VIC5_9TREM|nr:Phosphodiesterase-nucleotide pyrophosphatase [Fasciolopsis buski]